MSMILIVEDENSIGEIVELNLKLAQHNAIRVTTVIANVWIILCIVILLFKSVLYFFWGARYFVLISVGCIPSEMAGPQSVNIFNVKKWINERGETLKIKTPINAHKISAQLQEIK